MQHSQSRTRHTEKQAHPVMKKKTKGRFAIMRDLQDHLIAGRINFFDLGIYTAIHWQVEFGTGVWWGSAPKLHATGPSGCSLRSVQRSLKKLTAIGFLKPFHRHGQRGNYPVLVNKYEHLSGALKGKRLNATQSIDWRHPTYESCAEHDAEQDAERDAEHAPIHNALSNTQDPELEPAAITEREKSSSVFSPTSSKADDDDLSVSVPKAFRERFGHGHDADLRDTDFLELAFEIIGGRGDAAISSPPNYYATALKNLFESPGDINAIRETLVLRRARRARLPAAAATPEMKYYVEQVRRAVEESEKTGQPADELLREMMKEAGPGQVRLSEKGPPEPAKTD